jgi:hypothetical protein
MKKSKSKNNNDGIDGLWESFSMACDVTLAVEEKKTRNRDQTDLVDGVDE